MLSQPRVVATGRPARTNDPRSAELAGSPSAAQANMKSWNNVVSRRHVLVGGLIAGTIPFAQSATPESGSSTAIAPTRGALSDIDPRRHSSATLREAGREGMFTWHDGDLSAQVSGDQLQGVYVPGRDASGREGAWMRAGRRLRPEMFGAAGGDVDDTASLQALLDHLLPGYEAVIADQHRVVRELSIQHRRGFRINGGGHIEASADMPVRWGFGLIRFIHCDEFVLSDMSFDGRRGMRTPHESPAHNVIFESCARFTCQGVRSSNAVCDGFMLLSETPNDPETHCVDFKMINCEADNCFRQGCTVAHGHSGLFDGGSYSRSNGTAPEAGVDLEADGGNPLHSVTSIRFRNVRFEANAGFGLLVAAVLAPRNIEATDCRFINNRSGAISWGAQTGSIVRSSITGFDTHAVRGAIDVPVGAGVEALTIEAPVFREVTADSAGNPLIYVHGASGGHVTVDRLDVDSCAAVVAFWAADCSLRDSPRIVSDQARFHGAILVYGARCRVLRNRISDFYGAAIYVEAPEFIAAGNQLIDPRFGDERGCIFVRGPGAQIIDNVVSASGRSVARYAIVASSATVLARNRTTGFLQPEENIP